MKASKSKQDMSVSFEAKTVEKTTAREGSAMVVTQLRKTFMAEACVPVEVLRGVSFTVSAGEMVAITGASGAGKSTLLHVLGGLEKADEGSVRLNDFEITRASALRLSRFREQSVGFVFQFHHLLQDLTALENVALPLRIARLSRTESVRRAFEALEQMGLSARAGQRVTHLSGGEQQRVAVARAIVKHPRFVFADEPTGNLDAEAGKQLGNLLAAFAREHKASVIIATHNEGLAMICDRTLHLHDGGMEEV